MGLRRPIAKGIYQVEPDRFYSDTWGYPEGDIQRSYSGDLIPNGKIRTPFRHGAHLYTTVSIHSKGIEETEALAYRLKPVFDSQSDPFDKTQEVEWRGQRFCLGEAIAFIQRPLMMGELRDLIRRQYAYGGYFAARAGTYLNFLSSLFDRAVKDDTKVLFASEIVEDDLPSTQQGMKKLVEMDRKALELFDK